MALGVPEFDPREGQELELDLERFKRALGVPKRPLGAPEFDLARLKRMLGVPKFAPREPQECSWRPRIRD